MEIVIDKDASDGAIDRFPSGPDPKFLEQVVQTIVEAVQPIRIILCNRSPIISSRDEPPT